MNKVIGQHNRFTIHNKGFDVFLGTGLLYK